MKLIGLLFVLNNSDKNSDNAAIIGAVGNKKTPTYKNFKPTVLKLIPLL